MTTGTTPKLHGRLDAEQLKDLDSLILKLQSFNLCNMGERISLSDIRPLPPDENGRLWTYIRHYCKMAALNSRNLPAIRNLCNSGRNLDLHDLVNDAVNDMSLHVYRYVWRKYVSSDDAGYLVATAYQGFKTWKEKMTGHVSTVNTAFDLFASMKDDIFKQHKKSIPVTA